MYAFIYKKEGSFFYKKILLCYIQIIGLQHSCNKKKCFYQKKREQEKREEKNSLFINKIFLHRSPVEHTN
jgi:hypothetical protein